MRRSNNASCLLCWLLVGCLMIPDAAAFTKYFFFCSLAGERVHHLNLTAINKNNNNNENRNLAALDYDDSTKTAGLRSTTRWLLSEDDSVVPALALPRRRLQQQDIIAVGNRTFPPPNDGTTPLRQCLCYNNANPAVATEYYCPADREYCAVPGTYYSTTASPPVCLNVSNNEIFVRSVWPILIIWFVLAFLFCLFTWPGRNAIDYVVSTCLPCWNPQIIDILVDRTNNNNNGNATVHAFLTMRSRIIRVRYRDVVEQVRIAEEGPDLNEYELRTKRFKAATHNNNNTATTTTVTDGDTAPLSCRVDSLADTNNNNNDAVEEDDEDACGSGCAICFLPLEEGERVGAIECGHTFHVDCLKGWIQRRNVCPLCMHQDIAKPRRRPPPSQSMDPLEVSPDLPEESNTNFAQS